MRGDSDYDVTILKIDLDVPVGANCLRFDFRFLSDEFPEFVGSSYNDAFIAELDTTTWSTSGSTITAPDNFAFDTSGNPISINSSGATAMSATEAAGTTYDGATTLLSAGHQVTSGAHSLYLSIFDQGDAVWDSAVFVDNLTVGTVANPTDDCRVGAVPVNQAPTITPANGSVQYSDAITSFNITANDAESDPLTLSASNLPAGLSFLDNGDGTGTVSGTVTAAAGTYTVTYSASDGVNAPSTATGTITVGLEDCTLTAPATVLSSAAGTTALTASMSEPDASLGDRTGKGVDFAGTDAALNAVGPFSATTDASAIATANAPLTAGVYAINASFPGDTFYKPCATTSDTLVTVSPAQYKATGGGYITNTTGRTSFGFNVISDVSGIRGQLQVRPPNKNRFHSTSVSSPITGSGNTTTWSGTGRWNGVDGYRYTVTVVDNGTSGKKGDTISIVIKNSAGTTTVFTTSGAQALKGGNIVVH